jgi:PAS domain S-box-containing protein
MEDTFYKRLLDNLGDGVYFVDRDRKITCWNRSAERITGYLSDEMVGTHCFHNRLQHIDGQGANLCNSQCPLALTIADGQPREQDIFFRHRDGHRVPLSAKISPIYDEEGASSPAASP